MTPLPVPPRRSPRGRHAPNRSAGFLRAGAALALAIAASARAQHADDIDRYIRQLTYDPRALLEFPRPPAADLARPFRNGDDVTRCEPMTSQRREQSVDQLSILSGMGGVVFPGALVRANQRLASGQPDAVTLPRGAVTVRVALPGLGARGTRTVPEATYTGVESAIDEIVNEWLAQPGGFQNAVHATFNSLEVHSAQQAALDLGLTANLSGNNASAAFAGYTDARYRTYVGLYRQVFYTASIDPPASPSAAFATRVSLDNVKRAVDDSNPPAYVRSVDYGRLILIRMDTSREADEALAQASLQYSAGEAGSLSADMSARLKKFLQESRVSIFVVGGGPAANALIFQPGEEKADRMQRSIREFGQLTPSNPAVPIGYTVNFLRDNVTAAVHLPTEFPSQNCSRATAGHVRLVHQGGFLGRFRVSWEEIGDDGVRRYRDWDSARRLAAGFATNLPLDESARNIRVEGWAFDGLREIEPSPTFAETASGGICVRLRGALPNPRLNPCD